MKETVRIMIGCLMLFSVASCRNGSSREESQPDQVEEDQDAKKSLQGIWIDEESETVLFRAKGDSIYYADSLCLPLHFRFVGDTLYLTGMETTAYKVDKQTENSFWFHSLTEDIVKVYKSENIGDTIFFKGYSRPVTRLNEVIKKDSVFNYDGKRFRGYVYINPTKIKVSRMSYTDEGIGIENYYYDNVIHICVYQGKQCMFSRDVKKKDFSSQLPKQFYDQAILKDMMFTGVDQSGYHFESTLCIPDDASCYVIELVINKNREIQYITKEF